MRNFIVLFVVSMLITAAVALDFRVDIDVACGSDVAAAAFGVSNDASNGFDFGVDELYIPYPPAFAMYFESMDTLIPTDLIVDIRDSHDSLQIWDATTTLESGPQVILTWNPDDFPADSGELKIGYHLPGDTVTEWSNMAVQESLVYDVGNEVQIVLRHDVSIFEEDTIAPQILSWTIAAEETIYDSTTVLSVTVMDTASGVDTTSMQLTLNSVPLHYLMSMTVSGDSANFTYEPAIGYFADNHVVFSIADFAGNIASDEFTFYYFSEDTGDTTPPDSGYIISGMVIPEGEIFLSGSKVNVIEPMLSDTTDMMGMFSMPAIDSDTYTVVITRDEYFPIDTVIYLVSDTFLVFNLAPCDSGVIVIDGHVTLEGESDHSSTEVSAAMIDMPPVSTTTDETGFFYLEVDGPGFYYVKATHDGFAPESIWVIAFDDTTVDLALEHTAIPYFGKSSDAPHIDVSYLATNALLIECYNVSHIEIIDNMGRTVRNLKVQSSSQLRWNMTDIKGEIVPTGVYFIRAIGINGEAIVKKTVIVR